MFCFQVNRAAESFAYGELLKRFPDATPAVKAALADPGRHGRQPIIASYVRNGEVHERLLLERGDGKLFDYLYMPESNPPIISDEAAWVGKGKCEASLMKAGCSDFKYSPAYAIEPQKEMRPSFMSERFSPPLTGLVPKKLLPGGAPRQIQMRKISPESSFTSKFEEVSGYSAAMPPSLLKRFPDAPDGVRSLPEGYSYLVAKYKNQKGQSHERLLVQDSEGKLFDYRMSEGRIPPLFSYKDAWRTADGWEKSLGCSEISFCTQDGKETLPKQKQAASKAEKPPSMVESKPEPLSAKELESEAFRKEMAANLSQYEFDLIEKYSKMYGVDLGIALAMLYKESSFLQSPPPTSKTAAKHYGLGQLSPLTAAEIKGKDGKFIFTFKHFRAIKKERKEKLKKEGKKEEPEMSLSDFSKSELEELVQTEKNIHASLSYLSSRISKFGLALGLEAYFQGDKPVREHLKNPYESKLNTAYSEETLKLAPQFNDTVVPFFRGE